MTAAVVVGWLGAGVRTVEAVEDTTPPTPTCTATFNAHAGFFTAEATDDTDNPEDIQLFIHDTGSGTVFGPHASGFSFKYVQSQAEPGIVERGGIVFIYGTGPASVIAVDTSGNTGEVSCS